MNCFEQGLIWLYIFSTGLFVVSLEPGYLDFDNLPDTNFSCVGKVIGGYYADLETNCQMFHVCTIGQLDEPMDIRFLCLNGTVFDQETRVCERIDEVDCSKSEKFYSLNLELYGNTQPPILEENADTESPNIENSTPSSTTTTTTTTPRPTTITTTRQPQYFTTSIRPLTPSPYHKGPSSHHYSLEESQEPPEYSPEEINISLNPGAPPNIRTKPFEFTQNRYSDNVNSNNKKVVVTTHSSVFKSDNDNNDNKQSVGNRLHISSSTTESDKINYNKNIPTPRPNQNNFNFNFNYHAVDPQDFSSPRPHNYHYQHNIANLRPPGLSGHSYSNNPYRSTTQSNEYLPVSRKNFEINRSTSTARSFFLQPIKSPSHQYFTRTEQPQGEHLPLPVFPTLSPIVFSSPAPFTLTRHIENKRYTDEHELPPRIIISASASVSDASGRTLNYSLGTIGAAQILAQPPASYDEYKEDDVVLDPFYHDVPKIQNKRGERTKRDTGVGNEFTGGRFSLNDPKISSTKTMISKRAAQLNPSDIIKSEDEAIEVLKFLFDWYKTHEKTTQPSISIPISPDIITHINEEFSQRPYISDDYSDDQTQTLPQNPKLETINKNSHNSRNKFNIVDDLLGNPPQRPSDTFQEPVTPLSLYNKKNSYEVRSKPVYDNYNNQYSQHESGVTHSANNLKNPSSYRSKEFSEHHNVPTGNRETYDNHFRDTNVIRRKPNRGRHRYTVPSSVTESQSYPPSKAEIYDQRTEANRYKQKEFNYGNSYEDAVGILNNHASAANPATTNYEESYEQKPAGNINHQTLVDSNISYGPVNHQTLETPIKITQTSASQNLEADNHQNNKKAIDDIIAYEAEDKQRSNLPDTTLPPSSMQTLHRIQDIYDERNERVRNKQKQLNDREPQELITELPVQSSPTTFADDDQKQVTDYSTNESVYLQNDEKQLEHAEKELDLKAKNSSVPISDDNLDADLELNRQESQKSSSQINGKPTEGFAPFDAYDYVNDNYEPFTYQEKPFEHNSSQTDHIAKGVIHEETNINIDLTEPAQLGTTVQESKSYTVPVTTPYYQDVETVQEDKSDTVPQTTPYYQDVEYNLKTDTISPLQTTPKEEIGAKSVDEHSPKYKYIDNNLNSFADILKSLRDFQKYEQNIYDYNNNLTEVKENFPNINEGKVFKDDMSEEMTTTSLPTTWEQKPETTVVPNTQNLNEVPSTTERKIFTINFPFNNFATRTPLQDEERLYTSKPLNDAEQHDTHTTVNVDYVGETESPKYIPFGTEYTETTSSPAIDTTTFNSIERTTLPIETTTMKYVGVEILSAETTTLKETNEKIQTTSRSRIRGRSRNPQKFKESKRHRVENRPEASYRSTYSRGSRRKPNRGRYQNKPHLEDFKTVSEVPPGATLLSVTKSDSTPDWGRFDTIQVKTVDNLSGQFKINDESNAQLYTNNILVQNVTESSETTVSRSDSTTEAIEMTTAPSDVENSTIAGFFITRPVTSLNKLVSANLEDEQRSASIALPTERSFTTTNIHASESEDTVVNSTPGTVVLIVKTTEKSLTDGYTNLDTQEYASTFDATTPTAFRSVETLFTDTENVATTQSIPRTSSSFAEQYNEASSVDITTPTTIDLFEKLSTEIGTTTDNVVTAMKMYENHSSEDDLRSTAVPSTTPSNEASDNIIEFETSTTSEAVSEVSQEIPRTTNVFLPTTQQPNTHSDVEKLIKRIEDTTNSMIASNISQDRSEDISTTTEGITTVLTHETDSETHTDTGNSVMTTLPVTINPITTTPKNILETTIIPMTKLEINTRINIQEDHGTHNKTEGAEKSEYSSENEVINENHREDDSENRNGRYNGGRTRQKLPKKTKPGYRRFSTRHRFSSVNATPRTIDTRNHSHEKHTFHKHRFSTLNVTLKHTDMIETIDSKLEEDNLHKTKTPDEVSTTDAPLSKNVKPTQEDSKKKIHLSTTPLSMLYRVNLRKEKVNKQFIFNCFGKPLHNFYSDPRDCRLFHYCTNGYTKNQLLDMKFVCDLGTHFDDEKLVCTKEIPKRCL